MEQWECSRWEVWVLTSIQLEKKDRKGIKEMFSLPWDDQFSHPQTVTEISMEERKQRIAEMRKK